MNEQEEEKKSLEDGKKEIKEQDFLSTLTPRWFDEDSMREWYKRVVKW